MWEDYKKTYGFYARWKARRKLKKKLRTQYMVVLKPLKSLDEFYLLGNVKTLCTTYSKAWAWTVFIVRGWRMPPDHDIHILTLRSDYGKDKGNGQSN